MHTDGLVSAKIQAPRFRSGLIDRRALEESLDDALANCRLVLLVAPAGYGKTAALSRQVRRLPASHAVAWISVDKDDDLRRLLGYLIEALDPMDPPWRVAPEALFDLLAQHKLKDAVAALASTLQATSTPFGVIALDDLHAVADPLVVEFLDRLIEQLPHNWTLVLSTRHEPKLSLGRWLARRELAIFDESALGFSEDEVRDLWRSTTGQDDHEQAQQLFERTRGWPAGLCLSLDTSRRSADGAPKGTWQSRRNLFDYLASEVLANLPQDMQQFLLRCSVLAELTAQRCERVSGQPRASALLEEIERRRLFVSVLDSEPLTLRLHDLFRDFLEERLRREFPDELPALLCLAAQGEPDPVRRTLTYLRANAWGEAQQSLADAAPDMIIRDEGVQLTRMIAQFPGHIQTGSPQLAFARGLHALRHDQYHAVRSDMAFAAAGFESDGRPGEAQRARAMQALATMFCGDFEEARRLGQEVRAQAMDLEAETISELLDLWYEGYHGPHDGPSHRLARVIDLLSQQNSAELWSRCLPNIFPFIAHPGMGAQVRRMVDGAKLAAVDGHESLRATANVTEAWRLLFLGDFPALESLIRTIEDDVRWLCQPPGLQARLLNVMIAYHVSRDDKEAVRATFDAITSRIAQMDPSSALPVMLLRLALRALAAAGDWQRVRQHLATLEHADDHGDLQVRPLVGTIHAQLALQEGRLAEALAGFRELADSTVLPEPTLLKMLIRTRLALAELENGSPSAAWQVLEHVIDQTAESGNVGQLLATGIPTLEALAHAGWSGVASEEKLASLRQWIGTARQFKTGSATAEAPHAPASNDASLSPRELEVLELIAGGQSNKLIAKRLDLSPHTVKRHVARILDRLDLESRLQAANWYRAHIAA
ncbi:LuxR C-terminal-related transcriptional regulator [Variovorax sp. KK3]|uniref:LuxR C-terminal-related transcriptional regulator n=1 Tax=Variovorax sp. KK3 TaxID=1855728 RepID=UPI00097C7332|nr:LuxR C-terminal-related transcriptional regulator [Variovorax sp. KK3]